MDPVIGMIVPPEAGEVPPEAPTLYPRGVTFIAEGLGLKRLTPEGYDGVIDRIADLASKLAGRGADAIVLMGTSLSFYRGAAFNRQLIETMEAATGLPATTMSSAIVEALRALDAETIALGTAYGASVNSRLENFLSESGFTVAGCASLGIEDVNAIFQVTADDLMKLGDEAAGLSDKADAIFLSCGGLRTLSVTRPLEDRHGIPVVSSSVAGAWAAMRLAGHDPSVSGFGGLLERNPGKSLR